MLEMCQVIECLIYFVKDQCDSNSLKEIQYIFAV